MNLKRIVFGMSMLLVLVLAACSPSGTTNTEATEAPMDEPMDDPTPMMTEDAAPAETEEERSEEDDSPMPVGGTSVMVAENIMFCRRVGSNSKIFVN